MEYKFSGHVMSQGVRNAYRRNSDDETLEPLVLMDGKKQPVGPIRKNDAVIFYNIRGEREIELTRSLTEKGFSAFSPTADLSLSFATMIEYRKELNVQVAFPPEGEVEDTLSDVLARHAFKQAKITEAEKAVHVTYFLNGKKEEPLPGEERIIVPSRKDVHLFDEAPEMSIENITRAILGKIADPSCPFIFANFPNVDVVGHIENEAAILRAVEAVDRQAGVVLDEARRQGLTVMVTADHGTVEKWLYPDGVVDTGHTDSPVPFILLHDTPDLQLRPEGALTDIAPTILQLFRLPVPAAMTGKSLIAHPDPDRIRPAQRLLVLVLDGWGESPQTEGNLIAKAATPTMDSLKKTHPWTTLLAAGEAVGLPAGTVGNSEAGHLHIGAGRQIYADRVRINRAIEDGTFFENEAFLNVMAAAKRNSQALHLLGIVSFFSSHGSLSHLFALMELAKRENVPEVYIHAMLGRRGEMPESGALYVEKIEKKAAELQKGKVVSVIGRYWSMDREENWDRIQRTYDMLVYGKGEPVFSPC
ncbi:2,3-bisphosphoglycerate-independent phosphoglycerate mutase [Syntrophus gentianae]|uniref:phosphoglycerate mutase (2,3-diphosphoglycerate-independent) n=1 Tax=Syntrophus gentianae TaxID=43775 RepID=A0A1H8AQ54_9BACT|nr:alkaline phosphatase family protein [Syntrophus gentianae]SEM72845.1 2,3-bisphosphoglycerate-independent phosphoglycerate mutase [Syntrophus gentianae]